MTDPLPEDGPELDWATQNKLYAAADRFMRGLTREQMEAIVDGRMKVTLIEESPSIPGEVG